MECETGSVSEMESAPITPIYPEQGLTEKILEGAFAVHNTLGCGFLERVYSNALLVELCKMCLAASGRFHSKENTKMQWLGTIARI
jgi:hypothetical protein